MIANARMYSVSPEAAGLWRRLLALLIERAELPIELIEHTEPKPIEDLWARPDKAAVFMCGLPFSQSRPQPTPIAAPVPSPPDFVGEPRYWSEMVVRKDSGIETLEQSFGKRLALTVEGSQSGYVAPLTLLHALVAARSADAPGRWAAGAARAAATAGVSSAAGSGAPAPLYAEVIAPQISPLGALTAVVEGRADIAPIDAYAYCLLQRYRLDLTRRVRVVARTPPTPIPLIVASVPGVERLQAAFVHAHEHSSTAALMSDLLLERFERPEPDLYSVLQRNNIEQAAFWRSRPLAARIDAHFPLRSSVGAA